MAKRTVGSQPAGSLVLDAEAAGKLAAGIMEAKLATIREIITKRDDIARMKGEDVDKLVRFAESVLPQAHGHCGIGCW